MRKQVAMYQSVEFDWMQTIADVEHYEKLENWVRISGVQIVDFEMLPGSDEVKNRAIAAAEIKLNEAKTNLEAIKNA